MTDPAGPGRSRRVGSLGRRQVVVVAAGLGAALLGTTPAVWVRAATWTPLSERAEVTLTGVQAAPAVSAAGLLIVASALALAMARRWGAVLAGVVVVGGAGVAVAAVLSVLADPAVPAVAAARELVGVGLLDGAATVSPAPWVALALALVTAVVGCLAVLTSRAWAAPSARHEPVTGVLGPSDADDPAWDALSRGQDPAWRVASRRPLLPEVCSLVFAIPEEGCTRMVGKPLESSEKAHLPKVAPPTNHGHTTAAWVTVSVVMLGAVVSAVAVVAAEPWLFWVGLAVIVVGLVVGRLLKMLGLGQPEPSGPTRGSTESGSDIVPSSKEQR